MVKYQSLCRLKNMHPRGWFLSLLEPLNPLNIPQMFRPVIKNYYLYQQSALDL
jgi:hypothetical protein